MLCYTGQLCAHTQHLMSACLLLGASKRLIGAGTFSQILRRTSALQFHIVTNDVVSFHEGETVSESNSDPL